jgi:hypothetical protein
VTPGRPDNNVGQVISLDLGQDGVAASHPVQIDFPRFVAPSLASDETHNTIKEFLIVVGCVTVPDAHFKFDHSFVVPEAKVSMKRLAAMRDALADPDQPADPNDPNSAPTPGAKPPLSVFGHADPVGSDVYNSELSQRRARAIYGMLIRDVSEWEKLFDQPHSMGGDHWGKDETTQMAVATGDDPNKTFTRAERKALIAKYMDTVCVRDGTNGEEPFQLTPTEDFLARGADRNRKGDVQGCGEFNPTFVMSKTRADAFDSAKDEQGRDQANEVDRRVIAFLFKPGSRIKPAKWPCPTIRDRNSGAVCSGRFWSDGDKRRAADPDFDKKFDTQIRLAPGAGPDDPPVQHTPTFACRFYHGIAQNSPCEGISKQWVLRILRGPPISGKADRPFDNQRYVVTMGDAPNAPQIRGSTDDEGVIRLPVFDEQTTMLLKLDVGDALLPPGVDPPDDQGDTKDFTPFTLLAGDLLPIDVEKPSDADPDDLEVKQRLFNLGYGKGDPAEFDADVTQVAVRAFQRNEKVDKTGVADAPTRKKLAEVYQFLPSADDTSASPGASTSPSGSPSPGASSGQ